MDLELTGKVALVTGGSQGIGRAIAQVLAEEGVDVAICARNKGPLEAAAKDIREQTGRRVEAFVADVSHAEAVDGLVEQVVKAFGRLDILVNNAGVPGGLATGPLSTVTDEKMLEDLNIKFMGGLRCARAAAPHMQRQGWGRIINIGGHSGRVAGGYSPGVRNVAIVHLTSSLARELGPSGITANVVHPGLTRSPFVDRMISRRAEAEGISLQQMEDRLAQGNATRRIVDAREIGYVVAFLASPKGGSITGEVIGATGGAGTAVFP